MSDDEKEDLLARVTYLEEQVFKLTSTTVYAYVCLAYLQRSAVREISSFDDSLTQMNSKLEQVMEARREHHNLDPAT